MVQEAPLSLSDVSDGPRDKNQSQSEGDSVGHLVMGQTGGPYQATRNVNSFNNINYLISLIWSKIQDLKQTEMIISFQPNIPTNLQEYLPVLLIKVTCNNCAN